MAVQRLPHLSLHQSVVAPRHGSYHAQVAWGGSSGQMCARTVDQIHLPRSSAARSSLSLSSHSGGAADEPEASGTAALRATQPDANAGCVRLETDDAAAPVNRVFRKLEQARTQLLPRDVRVASLCVAAAAARGLARALVNGTPVAPEALAARKERMVSHLEDADVRQAECLKRCRALLHCQPIAL